MKRILLFLVALCLCIKGFSQAPPFLDDVVLWYNADSSDYQLNEPATLLQDIINSNNATEGNATLRATFDSIAGIGRVYSFDNTTRYTTPSLEFKTFIGLFKNTGNDNSRLFNRNSSVNGVFFTTDNLRLNYSGSGSGGTVDIPTDFNEWILLMVTTSTENEANFARINFSQTSLPVGQELMSGVIRIGNPTGSFTGYLKEFVYLDRVISESEAVEIENYYTNIYAPPLYLGSEIYTSDFCPVQIGVSERYLSWTWSTGQIGDSLTITKSGKYWVDAIDIFGRHLTDTVNVQFPGNFISPFALCAGSDSLYDPGLDAFDITWQDGSTGFDYLITEPGEYYLTVNDTSGCSYSDTLQVSADLFPIETALGYNTPFCLGNELYLSSGFAEAETYTWSTGEETAFISPTISGTYWVEATNANGCVGRDTVDLVIAGAAPVVEFTNGTACEANAVVFTDQTDDEGSGIVNQTWVAGDALGVDSLQGGVVEYTFPATGSYPIELTVLLANGCSGTGRDTVVVHPLPVVGFNFDSVIPCAGNEVAYESQSGVPGNDTISAYHWLFGNGTTDTGIVGTTVFENLGVNTVQLSITTSAGCVDSLLSNVVVLGSPVADFDWSPVCVGMPTVFEENVNTTESGPVFYNWQFGDGFFSNFPNTSHVYQNAGVYNVKLTATGNDFGGAGCTHQITKQIRVYNAPTGNIATADACLGDAVLLTDLTQPVELDGVGDYVDSREWVLPFGYGQGPISVGGDSVQVWLGAEAGSYVVQLHFTTAAGCTGSASANVDVLELPEASFTLSVPEVAPPFAVVPNNTSSSAEGYVWLMNGIVVSTDAEPELAFPDSGWYEVMLVATNSLGCNDTTAIEIEVIYPVYDLGLVDIRYTISNNRLALRAVLANNGNVTIRSFRMDVQLGLSGNSNQVMEFEIDPGEVKEFVLPQDIEFLAARDLPYVCMEVGILPLVEVDLENNALCIGLEKEKAVFIDPYPNPVSGVVKLGFVLPHAGAVSVRISDASGREVDDILMALPAGYSLVEYDMESFSDGVYYFGYNYFGEEVVKRVLVVE